jgi:hypothetical protein
MNKSTKAQKRKPVRVRSNGVPVFSVSLEVPEPLYDALLRDAERNYRSLSSHIVAVLSGK